MSELEITKEESLPSVDKPRRARKAPRPQEDELHQGDPQVASEALPEPSTGPTAVLADLTVHPAPKQGEGSTSTPKSIITYPDGITVTHY